MGGKKKVTRVHSRYDDLPEDIKQLVDERLRDVGSTYTGIAAEVQELGYEISKSSIGRLALRRNGQTQALSLKLAIAKEQATIAASMSGGDTTAYAKGILNIVMTEITNRLLVADSDEYDGMSLDKVLEAASRIVKNMNDLAKFEFSQDKGKKAALSEFEALVDQYMGDDPELKEKIMEKVRPAAS